MVKFPSEMLLCIIHNISEENNDLPPFVITEGKQIEIALNVFPRWSHIWVAESVKLTIFVLFCGFKESDATFQFALDDDNDC